MNKENLSKLWEITKKVINYAFLLIVLGTGFYIGKMYSEYFPDDEQDHPTSSKDVSIAIDDHNRIFIIDKDSGEYQVLSDSVGVTIFKMYASRIYNTQPK